MQVLSQVSVGIKYVIIPLAKASHTPRLRVSVGRHYLGVGVQRGMKSAFTVKKV